VEGAKLGIRTLAAWLGRNEAGETLVDSIDRDLREAAAIVARTDRRPRVLCAYARDPRSLHVAGAATTPDALLAAAGARNAVPEFEGFRPLDAEAAVAAAPDVVLVSRRTLELLGGERELLAHPGLALTPAAQAGVAAVVVLDEQELFGAGPRTGAAVLALVRRLHPEATRDHEAEAVRDAPAADEDRP
jgi:iron complex transport system substrate-binding protein